MALIRGGKKTVHFVFNCFPHIPALSENQIGELVWEAGLYFDFRYSPRHSAQ